MSANKKLSIVIPTKNRSNYARWTIQAACQLSPDFEIIVADSSENNLLEAVLRTDGLLEKVKYKKTSQDNTVVDNFNQAIALAEGDYITCIGDDDFVTSSIIEVVDFAKSNLIDSINFSFPITYWWPDFEHRRRGKLDAATVRIEKYSGVVKQVDSKKSLRDAMSNLGGGPMHMPRIYAGLISRKVVLKINDKYGDLFGGVSPDVYSSTLLAAECQKSLFLDFPIMVPGISGASTSGKSSNGTHIGGLRDNNHIAPFKNLVWDDRVPEFYSVPTVWSYSMLKALEKLKIDQNSNFVSLYLKCILYHRNYLPATLASIRYCRNNKTSISATNFMFRAAMHELVYVINAVYRRMHAKVVPHKSMILDNLDNSFEAFKSVENQLPKLKLQSPSDA